MTFTFSNKRELEQSLYQFFKESFPTPHAWTKLCLAVNQIWLTLETEYAAVVEEWVKITHGGSQDKQPITIFFIYYNFGIQHIGKP